MVAHNVLQGRDISGGVHFHGTAPEIVVPRQLPADVRGFVGRADELRGLHAASQPAASEPTSVLVLVGTAGVGKSALAVRFAHQVRDRFGGGQLFVNLRGYDAVRPLEPQAVLGRFLHAVGVPADDVPAELEERAALYRSLLAERRVLVLLDNAATVGQVRPLLPGGSGCLVLVTSRNRLSGLAARDGALRVPVNLLSENEAVALVASATAGYRSGDPPEALLELAGLCARLPLALRIAAERAAARPLMPLQTLIAQLHGESSLWQALSTEDETEADAVRAVFAWSYRALPSAAARAFRLLGLFPGTRISAVCAAALLDEPLERAVGLLDTLAGAHLIEQRGPAVYQFHDLLRAFAADQARLLDAEEQRTGALTRVVQWYLLSAHAAGQAMESLRPGVLTAEPQSDSTALPVAISDRSAAAEWYQTEQENLPPLVRAASAAGGLDREIWQLAVTLGPLHATAGNLVEWLEIADLGLEAARRLEDRNAEAHVQMTRATALTQSAQTAAAVEALVATREIFAAAGDVAGLIDAENRLGLLHRSGRELPQAESCFRRVAELADEAGLPVWRALAFENLADAAEAGGVDASADELAARAVDLFRQSAANGHMVVGPILIRARVSRKAGRLEEAARHVAEAAEVLADSAANRWLEYAVAFERAAQDLAQGRLEEALEGCWRCLSLARSLGDRRREARALTALAHALLRLERRDEAIDVARTATVSARDHATAFDVAAALHVLAEALTADGQDAAAGSARAEAALLLEAYTDLAADDLRARLTRLTELPSRVEPR
ncbi:hypothetical protein KDL01_35875 [Actinospica durhamensis]|uniref:AAA+ ATPase domain-containing protein n=1 Tax=Actinospica durhamensis TaxID=1508375 RepID=A0A941EWQ7_9ACTN|nr:AAA family ATPase [Actinospica durhamensis]MBR7838703.1 hypothetical protein [Actinospica durhamensis]